MLASEDEEDLQWPYDTNLLSETHQASSLLTGRDATHAVVHGTALVATVVAKAFGPQGVYISKGTLSHTRELLLTGAWDPAA